MKAFQQPAELDAFLALRGLKRVVEPTLTMRGQQEWHIHRLLDGKKLTDSPLCFDSDLNNYVGMINLIHHESGGLRADTWGEDLRIHLENWYGD